MGKKKKEIKNKVEETIKYDIDRLTGKPPNISFLIGDNVQEFAVYTIEDLDKNYRNLPIKKRFQFGLEMIFAEPNVPLLDFRSGENVKIPGIKEKIFSWMYYDSIRSDTYPNFIEACTLTDEGLGGEMIQTHKHQTTLIAFDNNVNKMIKRESILFRTTDIINLMKEYADNYTLPRQVSSRIKFWNENRTYAIQNLKTEIKQFFTESMKAELDLLEEYRKNSEPALITSNHSQEKGPNFPYLKFLREDQDTILFESLMKCDLLKVFSQNDRYIFNGPTTALAATMNKLIDLEFISEAFTVDSFIRQFLDKNGNEIIKLNFEKYRERMRNQHQPSRRITPLFALLVEFDDKARKN